MALTLSQRVDRFIDDTDIAHMIIHGDIHTVVRTEGGLVRSFASVGAEIQKYYTDDSHGVLSQMKRMNQDMTNLVDYFTSIYLGPLSSDPAGVFQQGTFYFNINDKLVKFYDGTGWTYSYIE